MSVDKTMRVRLRRVITVSLVMLFLGAYGVVLNYSGSVASWAWLLVLLDGLLFALVIFKERVESGGELILTPPRIWLWMFGSVLAIGVGILAGNWVLLLNFYLAVVGAVTVVYAVLLKTRYRPKG